MANARHDEIHSTHKSLSKMNEQIVHEDHIANKLKKQLEHEKVVLYERKRVHNNINVFT